MSTDFTGVTFAKQKVTPADDAIVRRAILPDGILTGCALSYSGSTLTMAAGQLMVCGRQIKHPSAQNWAVSEATSGYARLLLTIDLTRTASKETFDQVVDTIEYATSADGFSELEQSDINSAGTKYQIAVCVVSLGTGGITGIVEKIEKSEAVASKPYAVIGVTYPSGSTCTCTNGTKTLTAKDTSGKAMFVIPAAGTWTVKAVKGSQTTSKAVSISTEGQVATVTLSFELVLFRNGAYQNIGSFNNATITSGNLVMAASGNDGSGGAIHRTFVTDVKLDLTNYKTLTFSLAEFTINSAYAAYRKVWFGVCSDTIGWQAIPADSNVKAKTVLTNTDQGTDKTVTVDISALTGSFYVFVYEDVFGSTTVSNKSIIIN